MWLTILPLLPFVLIADVPWRYLGSEIWDAIKGYGFRVWDIATLPFRPSEGFWRKL